MSHVAFHVHISQQTFILEGAEKHRFMVQRWNGTGGARRRFLEASRIDRTRDRLNILRSFERRMLLNRGETALGELGSKPRSPRPSHHRRCLLSKAP